jgi:pilus assembly protein CpaF
MSRTFRELAYERQHNAPQAKDAYETLLEQVRAAISKDHAEMLAQSITEKDASEAVKRLIGEYVGSHQHHINGLSMQQLADKLYGDMAGFGFLDKYITDPDVEEINGNSWRDIEIVTRSGWRKIPERFLSPQHAADTLRKMVRLGGLVLDGTNPIVDSYITEGIRVSAMIPPVADRHSGVVFSIRRQRMAKVSKEQIIGWHTATPEMLEFLTLCVNHGVSVGIAGKTGSGKTTDIAFLLNAVDVSKRIYTIEETRELDLFSEDKDGNAQNRVIHTCTRPSDLQTADIDMNDLLRKALRFSPDIIAVAEMRGAEAMVAQEAARTGHVVVTSLHANSARKAYGRILSMCQMSGTNISTHILMGFVTEAFPVMVFKKQMSDGTRRIMEIVEATSIQNGVVQANTIYRFETETGEYVREHGITDELAESMRGNGADKAVIERFREERI